ncbi:MviM Predicted dehydrogenases and related proteins [Candidatus Nanopelagicaceae bacterium]
MKILVIGLGSMGQRRIRNLRAIGGVEIAGMDIRHDRRRYAKEQYSINTYESVEESMLKFGPEVFIISTSPSHHMHYAFFGFEKGIHCFIEASVTDADKIHALSKMLKDKKIIMAPSCTMKYFPGPKKIKELLDLKVIGQVKLVNYQTGQYLPDWHPWESIHDYYVSKRETGGAREIVPFELTWLNPLFGNPTPKNCIIKKLSNFEADIDDYYQFSLDYDTGVVANFQIEVLSRPVATRELRIIGTEGQIAFSGDSMTVKYVNLKNPQWQTIPLVSGTVQKGYINPEEPYIAELNDFLVSVRGNNQEMFPNDLDSDYKVLNVLRELEGLANGRE